MKIQRMNFWTDSDINCASSSLFLAQDFDRTKSELSKQDRTDLVEVIYPVAVSAFNVDPSDEFYKDVENHIFEADILVVCAKGDVVLGFASVKKLEALNTMFIHGVAISKDAQW